MNGDALLVEARSRANILLRTECDRVTLNSGAYATIGVEEAIRLRDYFARFVAHVAKHRCDKHGYAGELLPCPWPECRTAGDRMHLLAMPAMAYWRDDVPTKPPIIEVSAQQWRCDCGVTGWAWLQSNRPKPPLAAFHWHIDDGPASPPVRAVVSNGILVGE